MCHVERYICKTPEGFVQYVAVNLLPAGYLRCIDGVIAEPTDPVDVDDKLFVKLCVEPSKNQRWKAKLAGYSNVMYLRYQRRWAAFATLGKWRTREIAAEEWRDIRREPLKFFGYSIAYRHGGDNKWHSSVRIEEYEYRRLKKLYQERYPWAESYWQEAFGAKFPYENYAGVLKQKFQLFRAVNRLRTEKGHSKLKLEIVDTFRRTIQVF